VISKDVPVAMIGENFDLTYKYEHLGNDVNILTDILYDKNEFSKKLTEAKKPMLIIGQALLNREDSIQIYSLLETFIEKFNMVNDEWNGFNVLQLSASRAGSLEVGCYQKNKNLDDIFDDARNEKVKLLISFGADEIDYENFEKSKIVYMGTHGDKGASKADIILPSAAYTEKDGIYINTEGRPQFANKASFPPGEAKEDWKIINQISELMSLNWSFIEQGDVRAAIFEDYPHLNENFNDQINEYIKLLENKSKDEIEITPKDTRTAKEKKSDTLNENIKDFENNSAQKIFNLLWKDLSDRQREYLRKYNYPETWSEFTEYYGFKVVNDIKKKNNVVLPYEEQYAKSLGKAWDDLSYNQKKWAYTKRNKNNLIGLADDANFTPDGIVVISDNQEAYYAELKEINFENKELIPSIKDFYVTDTISRHSSTMAECSRARKEMRNPIKEKAS
jgi:NADH dehydrogenase/NADH:ubiquinone oxidoreductase subunit G